MNFYFHPANTIHFYPIFPYLERVTKIIWALGIPIPGSTFKEYDTITKKPLFEPCFHHKDFSFELCGVCGEQVAGERFSAGLTTCSTECTVKKWDARHDFIITGEREQKGKRPPRFWEVIKRECFRRDNNTCQGCGKTKRELDELAAKTEGIVGEHNKTFKKSHFILNAHHIRPISEGGDNTPGNLITLCGKCHKKKHSTDANRKRKHIGLEFFGFVPVGSEG
jgi:5-methylcytosine-specific restriction endonuclease McrA